MLLLGFMMAMAAAPVVFESSGNQAALVELYTSEGCSSCPPAEEQFAQLCEDPKLWKDIVPVAFHVNYWDDLGWPDRFASPAFAQRQRDYAALWKMGAIHTPAFVWNGREGAGTSSRSRPGILRVQVQSSGEVGIAFEPADTESGPFVAEVVPMAGGIVSDVHRGENAGRRLAHEFVALALIGVPLASHAGAWTGKCSLPQKTAESISAVAVWIHLANDPTPVQAAGGWLKNNRERL